MNDKSGLGSHTLPIKNRLRRLPLTIPVYPYLRDHRFAGRVIFPAVEILQRLAQSAQPYGAGGPIRRMHAAAFDRLITIDEGAAVIEACHELEIKVGCLSSRLITEGAIKNTGISRTKVHAAVDFPAEGGCPTSAPADVVSALEGVCTRITSRQLYAELVPFGPSYRNVTDDIFLAEGGAMGQVFGADHGAPVDPLGCLFVLDGALHIACAWGQRYRHAVLFPVGFAERRIVKPTVPGQTYRCLITPVSMAGTSAIFDILIHDSTGNLCEEITGMVMKDITGGRVKPPSWVQSDGIDVLASLREHCLALSIVEIDTIADFAKVALTDGEGEGFTRFAAKRRQSYLAARLALKYLARKLAGGDKTTPAQAIHTMCEDRVRPSCPIPGGGLPVFCSASHDRRFAFAAADDGPVGIDVEQIAPRVLKARHLYMGKEEMALTETSPLGVLPASLRVWSIKEGVAKATDRPLTAAWREAVVREIGPQISRLTVAGEDYAAFHAVVDDHLFTLVKSL